MNKIFHNKNKNNITIQNEKENKEIIPIYTIDQKRAKKK
jgi:hypothetical protein